MSKARKLAQAIGALARKAGRPVKLMEVCGTHTVALFRHGIRALLPESIKLLSGPGCPVCVTSIADVEAAIAYAQAPGAALATFGDMMRVPGANMSLYEARAEGADVRVVYSPLDALEMARAEPKLNVVFFATGFETTSPLIAATLGRAQALGVGNFFIHSAHKLVPPALRALLSAREVEIGGFMLPGHVSTIIGSAPYGFVARDFGVPSVVTGFGAEDMLEGILMLLGQITEGRAAVEIQYSRVVRPEGNPRAIAAIEEWFEPTGAEWRGIGSIPMSGLALREEKKRFDVRELIKVPAVEAEGPRGCACGEVLRGVKTPPECALFGGRCTPERPVGACMVSAEGSCAAYYRYGGYGGFAA